MSFVLGVVFGIAFGLAVIVAFVKSENAGSKQRTDLASGIAAFARMTVEDSRKIFTPEQYPSWVVFSNQQKVKSLTFFLGCIW
ncbi:synaptotagmin-5-like [Solanum stenotomum]|uniref:synaptotagmin-5-like n=1 Tax=Solanum stenotomum TaxID=172797 RepID=UPI0020D0770B|nr:synaptotagmin-5-like [Solanum stenotomum]